MYTLSRGLLSRTLSQSWSVHSRRYISVLQHTFTEGEHIWLCPLDGTRPNWRTLDSNERVYSSKGTINARDIIGRSSGDLVRTNSGDHVRLQAPTLTEHIIYTPRIVTPVYPVDASDVISLLDLHVEPHVQKDSGGPELEILEAGTGHGALALHLVQKLQAANPLLSSSVLADARQEVQGISEPTLDALADYRSRRKAVLHTIDSRREVTEHASKIIGSFRGALYLPHIDIHTGDVGDWLRLRLAQAQGSFLQHVILDLPNISSQMALATEALHPGGTILTFCPSISQIERLVLLLREKQLPLVLDRVVELSNNTNGGRDWDVRLAEIRSSRSSAKTASSTDAVPEEVSAVSSILSESDNNGSEPATNTNSDNSPSAADDGASVYEVPDLGAFTIDSAQLAMVARPRPVIPHVRSAFVGVFRKRWPDENGPALTRHDWRGSAAKSKEAKSRRLKKGKYRGSSD